MNVAEIEKLITALAEGEFEPERFLLNFVECFGAPDATVKKLAAGTTNKSDQPGGLWWRGKMHGVVCAPGDLDAAQAALWASPAHVKDKKLRFLLATDGQTLRAEDIKSGETLNCTLEELTYDFRFFLPLANYERFKVPEEQELDVKATSRLTKLYDALIRHNPDWEGKERQHDLNRFMARLIFCLFAEDTKIFPVKHMFSRLVKEGSDDLGQGLREALARAFGIMNTPDAAMLAGERRNGDFPYVNGALFEGMEGQDRAAAEAQVPAFNRAARRYLLDAGALDWSQINPDIFGSMIQAVVNTDDRSELGMHYTSVPNILTVLEPLFLNDLRQAAKDTWDKAEGIKALLVRLSRVRVFDPACGSGNFLVIAYRELRALENSLLERLYELDGAAERNLFSHIELRNFYGIELDDFAAETAKLALWVAEYQNNQKFEERFGFGPPALPLKDAGQITCANALREDWFKICPPGKVVREPRYQDLLTQVEMNQGDVEWETYITGNPPYKGDKKTEQMREDMKLTCSHIHAWKTLDYVAGWYVKSAEFCAKSDSRAGIVSTNSICQGQQVPALWPWIFDQDIQIGFAHLSFKWDNLAARKAGVTVIAVGLRRSEASSKLLLERVKENGENSTRSRAVENIGPYLIPGSNIWVEKASKSLFSLPLMEWGNKPTDDGNLVFPSEKVEEFDQIGKQFIRIFWGASEIISSSPRSCLWIEDSDLEHAGQSNEVARRIIATSKFRADSKAAETRPAAAFGHRFRQIQSIASVDLIAVPSVSSENRDFLPVAHFDHSGIVGNSAFALYDAPIWCLALIASRMHWVWIGTVCSRLRTDFRYSNTLGWNTFPVPDLTDLQKDELTHRAEAILLAREAHFPKTIADLYKPADMPEDLREAHRLNDEMLERIYRDRPFRSDTDRLEHLFKLYAAKVGKAA